MTCGGHPLGGKKKGHLSFVATDILECFDRGVT